MNVTVQDQQVRVDLPRFYLNQSRWKTYQDCDRLYAWQNIENLEPIKPRKPLVMGTAIHQAQVAIHSAPRESQDDVIKSATAIAQKHFRTHMTPKGPRLPHDEAEIKDGEDLIGRLIPAYHEHYKNLGQQWRPLGQELSFEVEVGEGSGVILVGTIDNLVAFRNGLWLVDYKTMAKKDMREFMKYEIDIQLTAYIYGGTKKLSLDAQKQGKPPVLIRGAIIDGLIKTQVPDFHRELYTRSIDDLREFELEFCMKVWEIAAKHAIVKKDKALYQYYTERMYDLGNDSWKTTFPKNTQQCFRYGTCPYRDLCMKDNDVRRTAYQIRGTDYVDKAAGRIPGPQERTDGGGETPTVPAQTADVEVDPVPLREDE